MQVTICTANCVGQAGNCSYPNRVTVVTPEQLQEAVKKDHVCAEFKGNYRSVENFIRSDVIVMDIDNDHTEVPAEWITPEKLEELFSNVDYLLAPSRHHLLDKEGKSARPRYHMYFPISEITDASRYANLKKAIQSVYSFFDGNALDAARFIFGAECDEMIYHDGWMTVDEEVDIFDIEEEDFDSDMSGVKSTGPILKGSRNNTMSRFAGRILKKYGDTEKAHEAFLEHARKCDPPLPDSELKSIWNSAVKFYRKSIVTQDGYVPPEEYNADFEGATLKPEDYSDIGQAKILVREYGEELKYTSATDFLRFDGDCWREDKQLAIGAVEEFLDLQLQDAMDEVARVEKALEDGECAECNAGRDEACDHDRCTSGCGIGACADHYRQDPFGHWNDYDMGTEACRCDQCGEGCFCSTECYDDGEPYCYCDSCHCSFSGGVYLSLEYQ